MDNMKLIEAKTLSTAVSQIDFNTIPQTYTDLKLVMSARGSASNTRTNFLINFNGSSSGFTWLGFYGYGSTTGSNGGTGSSYRIYGNASANSNTSNLFSNAETYISNYSSTSKLKQAYTYSVIENNGSDNFIEIDATVWNSTSAITSLSIFNSDSSTFMVGSTFYLYGVSNTTAGTNGAKAYGGYVTEDSNYFYHTFLSSGTFTPTQSITADVLVIAGGGSGGGSSSSGNSGGGGAGGLVYSASQSLTTTGYAVTVGAGGAATTTNQNNGNNSVFGSITATGGGGGGQGATGAGVAGGSAGGHAAFNTTTGTSPSPAGQGNAGGKGFDTPDYSSGGGGGAGAAGGNGTTTTGGAGGNGLNTYSSWAIATLTGADNGYYAGGGGGATNGTAGPGGLGGGGKGGVNASAAPTSGLVNTGSGGGGAGNASTPTSGAGGSGLIIVRYAK